MKYYECETCEENMVGLMCYTDGSVDPKPIRICKMTRLELPESVIGCPKYRYAERKRIIDSCLLCLYVKYLDFVKVPNKEHTWRAQWLDKVDGEIGVRYICSKLDKDITESGVRCIDPDCPYLKKGKI